MAERQACNLVLALIEGLYYNAYTYCCRTALVVKY